MKTTYFQKAGNGCIFFLKFVCDPDEIHNGLAMTYNSIQFCVVHKHVCPNVQKVSNFHYKDNFSHSLCCRNIYFRHSYGLWCQKLIRTNKNVYILKISLYLFPFLYFQVLNVRHLKFHQLKFRKIGYLIILFSLMMLITFSIPV